jgi:hypothetical protein
VGRHFFLKTFQHFNCSLVDVVAASDTRAGLSTTAHQTVMALSPVQVGLVLLPLESILGQALGVVEVIVET